MSLREWLALLETAGIMQTHGESVQDGYLTDRLAKLIYLCAQQTVVDQLVEDSHMELDYLEFVEAVRRRLCGYSGVLWRRCDTGCCGVACHS